MLIRKGLRFVGAAALLIMTEVGVAQTRDPVGETADYTVDRSRNRTSSMVLSGNMTAAVTQSLPDNTPPAFEVKIDYTFRIQFVGTQTGTEVMPVDGVYFAPEFLVDLRRNGSYESPQFKVRHLGFGDARNMDGALYANCDKILIYDIQTTSALPFVTVAKRLLGAESGFDNSIEDMEITAFISYGLPVLGAAKLDITGVYNGMNVKAGADYDTP